MYKLDKLPYLFQDLEPYIDIHTMGLHYHKHAQNYLNKLNGLLVENNYDYRYGLEELVYHISELKEEAREDILFNLGGVLNHNLYWKGINPNKKEKPSGSFIVHLNKKFGSLEDFWKMFKKKALELKGSGYTFLVLKSDGDLEIMNVANQVTPLSFGYLPLFNVDMWEHAYYLNYENNKAEYLDNFEQIADFEYASKLFNNVIRD